MTALARRLRRRAASMTAGAALAMLVVAGPLGAQDAGSESGAAETAPDAGAYLAGRQAGLRSDFEFAARYFGEALARDRANPALLENAIAAQLGLGDLEGAARISEQIMAAGIDSQLSAMTEQAVAARDEAWRGIFDALEAGRTVGPLVDGLAQAWAYVGLGRMSDALDTFDEVMETRGLLSFGLYHKALALASAGDFEGADAIFSLPAEQGMQRTRRAAQAHAQVLSQLGRNADARALIDGLFGTELDPALADLRARLDGDDALPYDFVTSPREGLAEVYLSLAAALQGEQDDVFVLFYARIAQVLNPRNAEAVLLAGSLLERLERYDLANATYSLVPRENPAFHVAELGRADALRRDDRIDAAVEVLRALARTHGDLPVVHASLGDLMRQQGDMEAANAAYSTALTLYDAADPARWFVLYTRGITHERLGRWPEAEADFRASLAINPGQPQVLNYLGYSMVEQKVNLDEALGMIEEAVAAVPDSGAIVDSLGWVLYRLGRYDEAVVQMERAAELLPVDPVINDHLGDVYWAVGRTLEARFQWKRALSFDPEPVDEARIRRKLEIGLDAVLTEEGGEPVSVASDDG